MWIINKDSASFATGISCEESGFEEEPTWTVHLTIDDDGHEYDLIYKTKKKQQKTFGLIIEAIKKGKKFVVVPNEDAI
jgi:hypothetical protein